METGYTQPVSIDYDIRRDIPVKLMIKILIGAADAIINPARMAESGLTRAAGFAQIVSVFLEGVLVRSRASRR